MKIVATRSAQHLVGTLSAPEITYTLTQFSDGELYIKLDEYVQGETVWVVASTQAPANNILELLFLLDALAHAGAQSINLFFVYFAYARQTYAEHDEARSAQVITNALKQFNIQQTHILHAHAADDLHQLFNFSNSIDFDFFCNATHDVDLVVAPDKGASKCAQIVGRTCNKEVLLLEKTRPEHERVIIKKVHENITGKKVLIIDDMISTGRTLISAAQALKDAGAQHVSAAATHGLCNAHTYQELIKVFEKVSVTNSIAQKNIPGIEVWDIARFIEQILHKREFEN